MISSVITTNTNVMLYMTTTESLRLKIPDNIQIVYSLPYSPELNSVERVFQDIKKHLKNELFYLIEELENAVCKILNSFTPQSLKKFTFYPYIKEAFLE